MNQSVFLRVLAAIAAPAQQYRAIWVDAFHAVYMSPAQVDQLIDDLMRAETIAVFPEVRRSGGSYYLKSLEPPARHSDYAAGGSRIGRPADGSSSGDASHRRRS